MNSHLAKWIAESLDSESQKVDFLNENKGDLDVCVAVIPLLSIGALISLKDSVDCSYEYLLNLITQQLDKLTNNPVF
jgi:hypothetical protein